MASLVGLGIVSAGAAGFPDSSESGLACGSIRWFSLVAGLTTMAMFAVVAASVFARERDRRTLDVAMVCPNGPRRLLAGLLLVPQVQVTLFALLGFILTAAIEGSFPYGPEAVFWLSVWVYGTAIAVLGVLISVLVTSPTRSMVGTLGIVVGLSAAPLIVEWLGVLVPGAESPAMAQAASLLSPYQNLAGCFHWPREKGMDLPISLLGALAVTILCVRVVLWSGERLTRRSGT